MNPAVQNALNLINSIVIANGNQEITGTNLNAVLNAMLDSLYEITGNNEDLDTTYGADLVGAINEVFHLIDDIQSINIYSGNADPNVTPPNGGNTNVGDIYIRTLSGQAVQYWVKTGITGSVWIDLTANSNAVIYTPQTLTNPQKQQALLNLGYILIEGNLFEYKRNPNNNTSGILAGDIAVNGWIAPNNFGKLLVYVSGTETNIASWNIIDNLEF